MPAALQRLPEERIQYYGRWPKVVKDPPYARTIRYVQQSTPGVSHHLETPRARVAAYKMKTLGDVPEYTCTKNAYCVVGKNKHWPIVRLSQLLRPDVESQFRHLSAKWLEEVGPDSSLSNIVSNLNYLNVIAMGKRVIPLILRELEREPAPWFAALQAITGENPADRQLAGNFPRMAEAWIEWGRRHGLINGAAAP